MWQGNLIFWKWNLRQLIFSERKHQSNDRQLFQMKFHQWHLSPVLTSEPLSCKTLSSLCILQGFRTPHHIINKNSMPWIHYENNTFYLLLCRYVPITVPIINYKTHVNSRIRVGRINDFFFFLIDLNYSCFFCNS